MELCSKYKEFRNSFRPVCVIYSNIPYFHVDIVHFFSPIFYKIFLFFQ